MDDTLDDIFRLIRLKSAVYFQRDFHAPWAMRIEGTGFAQLHVVTRGACSLEVGGALHDLGVGDVLLFPHGEPHTLGDRPGREALAGPAPLFSTGGAPTRLICGHYDYRSWPPHPVIAELPAVVHVRSLDVMPNGAVPSALPLLMRELAGAAPGSGSIVERLAEVLLVQTLRAHYAAQPQARGFFAGLSDPHLGRAIGRMHRAAASRLTLDDLAREAGMSRSIFAQRFKQTIGLAPIAYLTKWRMLAASDMLRRADLSLARIALQVGYESDIAFMRAFKREFALTPSEFRRREA